MFRQLAAVLLFLFAINLAGCSSANVASVPGERLGYLLVGRNASQLLNGNQLVVFDAVTFQILRRVRLPKSNVVSAFARDSRGRVWLGLVGDFFDFDDSRVQVYSPTGDLLKTIKVGVYPDAGIAFARGKAFVPCVENGFRGSLSIIDMDSLDVIKTVQLSGDHLANRQEPQYFLTASSANSDWVMVTASYDVGRKPRELGENWDIIYAEAVFIDPESGEVFKYVDLGGPVEITDILTVDNQFILLSNSCTELFTKRPEYLGRDILIAKGPDTQVQSLDTPGLPNKGFAVGRDLFILSKADVATNDDSRGLIVYHLDGRPARYINLPHGWGVDAIAGYGGNVYVTRHQGYDEGGVYGLYRIDLDTGNPACVIPLPGATNVIMPEDSPV